MHVFPLWKEDKLTLARFSVIQINIYVHCITFQCPELGELVPFWNILRFLLATLSIQSVCSKILKSKPDFFHVFPPWHQFLFQIENNWLILSASFSFIVFTVQCKQLYCSLLYHVLQKIHWKTTPNINNCIITHF